MDIKVIPLKDSEIRGGPSGELGFGRTMTDRMFMQQYTPDEGWSEATIGPYRPLTLDPATSVFHYAQEIFEGTKAYRRADGKVNLFRPWENMRRFSNSARRMAMPEVDVEDHLAAVVQLVALEQSWVPDPPGALYIRPVMIATEPALGVHASESYLHYIILSPVGSYFPQGFSPVPVYISDKYRRAVVGGVGDAKTGGNYAASLMAGAEAAEKGYSQVLWLDAIEGRYVEEVGAMNICFVYGDDHIVTPPLTGSILPGVTRDSVITLGRDLGYQVSEALVDVQEMLADIQLGKISEVFGCGTAAVIAPVGKFGFKDDEYLINDYQVGPVAERLYDQLTGIQYGRIEDRFGWIHTVENS
ncbi:MAG: branched-chain amino acid aminotransferase [Chloroflexota bacterium]|nr:MAG: branched-chain amino acid aminotransferase [Chloroflexota bacterium]